MRCLFIFRENNVLSLYIDFKKEDYLMRLEDQEFGTYEVFFLGKVQEFETYRVFFLRKLKECIILVVIGQWCEDTMSACIDMVKGSS